MKKFLSTKILLLATVNLLTILPTLAFHLSGKLHTIKEINSEQHPILVFEDDIHRCITFDDNILNNNVKIIQSCINIKKKDNLVFDYYKVAVGTLLLNPNPKKILIIGIGGGVLPITFSNLLPNAQIEAVDINPHVVDIAKEFFDLSPSQHLKIIVNDGFEYAKNAKSDNYDLIILDAFGNDYIPKQMLSLEFFSNLKNLLTKNGILFINSLDKSEFSNLETNILNEIFSDYYSIIVSFNKLVVAGKENIKPKIHDKELLINQWGSKFKEIDVDINNLFLQYQ